MSIDTKALSREIDAVLIKQGVFDIDSMGWLNEYDHDPDFIGYAKWTTNPPYELDAFGWQDDPVPPRSATQQEQQLIELGTDFIGLMKSARYAIGLVFLHYHEMFPWDPGPLPFEFHEINALVAMNMASERLRGLLIEAFLVEEPERTRPWAQLRRALEKARELGFTTEVAALEALDPGTRQLRDARNSAVHRLALEDAKIQRRLINEERKRTGRTRRPPVRDIEYEEIVRRAKQADDRHKKNVDQRIELLRTSYHTLIKSGDLSFRLEHDVRQRRRRAGVHEA